MTDDSDRLREAYNGRAFRESLERLPWVRVPRVIASGDDWLAMEYVPSVKIDDLDNIEDIISARVVSLRFAACFAIQIIQNGLFHGDLHSGNAGVTEDGQLVFYDLGAVIALGDSPRKYMRDLFRAFTTGNAQTVVDSLSGMGVLDLSKCQNSRDSRALIEAVQAVMGQLLQAGNPEDVHTIVREQKILGRSQSRVFRPRLEFLYLLRNSGMVDAICRKLDPFFDSTELLKSILPSPPMDSALMAAMMREVMVDTPNLVKTLPTSIQSVKEKTDTLREDMRSNSRILYVWLALVSQYVVAHKQLMCTQ